MSNEPANGEPPRNQSAPHLIGLPGGTWQAWSTFALRGAGFPSQDALRLAATETATGIDRLLPASKNDRLLATASLRATFEQELRRIRAEIHRQVREPRFRAAVTWQNAHAVSRVFDWMLSVPLDRVDHKVRQAENLIASYVQRYAVKNETIGFFGPVGWGRLVRGGPALTLTAGPQLIASREVYFETWCVDAVAAKLSADATLRPWMRPRLLPYFRLEGVRLHIPMRGPIDLEPSQAAILEACDGRRTAEQIVEALGRGAVAMDPDAIYGALELARQMGVLRWEFELPLQPHAERRLRSLLEAIGPEDLKKRALEDVEALERAREAIAATGEEPIALGSAIRELEREFTTRCQAPSTRNDGQTYAARTLVYEDCRRDVVATVGEDVLARLRPTLELLLESARWFSHEVARRYREELDALHRRLTEESGSASVDLAVFQYAFINDERLSDKVDRHPTLVRETVAMLQKKWAEILEVPSGAKVHAVDSEAIRARVLSAFSAPGPGWTDARYVTPDILVSAASIEAACAGEFQLVLGELHLGNTLASTSFVSQHPDREELVDAITRDLPGPYVLPVVPKNQLSLRTSLGLFPRQTVHLEIGPDVAPDRAASVLRLGDCVVTRSSEGALEVRSRDGSHGYDVMDFMSTYITHLANALDFISPSAHSPRILIDDVIVARERWKLPAARLVFPWLKDPLERFIRARRLSTRGIPRHLFVKVPGEIKPLYVDLEAPHLLDVWAKQIRRAVDLDADATVTVTEMLPTPEQHWLLDHQGHRYSSELRLVLVDPRSPERKLARPG